MAQTFRSTQDYRALDVAHHVHPFTDQKALAGKGVRVITRAEGAYVWDSDGNKILDGMAGLWCVNVGYGRKELVDAATQQLQTLPYYNSFFQTSTPSQIELGKVLAEVTPPGLKRFFYTNSGSEANDTVIRLARHYWRVKGKPTKRTFIARTLGYHGSTLAAVSLGGMPHMHALDGELLPGFAHIPHHHYYTQGGGLSLEEYGLRAAAELEKKILELGADNVAAFIGEPVQGAGGVYEPPPGYWAEIQRICRKYDVLVVADEVICGFGRTGQWFGSQTYGIDPDLMPMAKGLSSGYLPIAGVAIHDRIWKEINEGGALAHGYTYSGHPAACAVAIANIQLIRSEGIVERVREEIAPYFRKCLQELAASHPIVGEIRGVGLIAAIQLVKNKQTREIFTAQDDAANFCRDVAANNGLIMRAVYQSMVLSPPLIITRAQVDEIVEKARQALDATAQKFDLG
ncbi:MAG TPA: aspartate aminotransferase family protein [Steroidobacter sp.]|uniref:aspartate aminotransferase family protein n=1 Tax=Steroidobacter sp. TaxID=1978227 RepID=UPI002ED9D705